MTTEQQVALLDMQMAVARMRLVAAEAERDNARDGWLCDHNEAMAYWQGIYDEAKVTIQTGISLSPRP